MKTRDYQSICIYLRLIWGPTKYRAPRCAVVSILQCPGQPWGMETQLEAAPGTRGQGTGRAKTGAPPQLREMKWGSCKKKPPVQWDSRACNPSAHTEHHCVPGTRAPDKTRLIPSSSKGVPDLVGKSDREAPILQGDKCSDGGGKEPWGADRRCSGRSGKGGDAGDRSGKIRGGVPGGLSR